jgi:hypothetical protein
VDEIIVSTQEVARVREREKVKVTSYIRILCAVALLKASLVKG